MLFRSEKEIVRTIESFDLSLQGVILAQKLPEVAVLTGTVRQLALFDHAATASHLNAIVVLDEEGRIIEDSNSIVPRPGNFSDRPFFRIHKESPNVGLYVSDAFQSRLTPDARVLAISRRIDKPDGSFGGAVVGTIRTSYFQNAIAGLSIGEHGSIAVFSMDGSLIGRQPMPPNGLQGDFRSANIFKHFPAQRAGQFDAPSRTDGTSRHFTFRQVADLPMVIVVALAAEDIYGAWQRKAIALALLTFCLVSAMTALALVLFREMARRKNSEQRLIDSEARYRLVADNSSDAIVLRNGAGARTYASPSFFKLCGRTEEELAGRSIVDFLDPEYREQVQHAFKRLRAGETTITSNFPYPRPDGAVIWLEAVSVGLFDAQNLLTEIVTNIRDVTERKMLELELAEAATTDSLTGLLNRRSFDSRFAIEWRRSAREQRPLSALVIDVDVFKSFNDTYGHLAGDQCLRKIAAIIWSSVRRPGDFVARYGGEEFVVILSDTDATGAAFVAELIRRAVTLVAMPHSRGLEDIVTISLGVATCLPRLTDEPLRLIDAADKALYDAKSGGRNRWSIGIPFDEDERVSA